MNALITTDKATALLAEARTVLDAKDIRDKSEALKTYARMAKDRDMELSAAEIRVRAERRIGEMLIELDLQAGRPRSENGSPGEPLFNTATLEELGIDKKLSMRAQQCARIPAGDFEKRIATWRQEEEQRATRAIASLFKTVVRPAAPNVTPDLPDGQYRVIYADPPWAFDTWSGAGKDRSAENHYPTMADEEIFSLGVGKLAAPDCCLFIWATGPKLATAFQTIAAWGFTYKTIGFTWAKTNQDPETDFAGNGYWTRANAELCLLATRGKPERLARDVNQLVRAPRGRHSAKPDEVAEGIERLVAGPYIELFRRGPARDGWDAWGNEAGDGS